MYRELPDQALVINSTRHGAVVYAATRALSEANGLGSMGKDFCEELSIRLYVRRCASHHRSLSSCGAWEGEGYRYLRGFRMV